MHTHPHLLSSSIPTVEGRTFILGGIITYTKIRDGANDFQLFGRCQNHKAGCSARATSEGRSVVVRKVGLFFFFFFFLDEVPLLSRIAFCALVFVIHARCDDWAIPDNKDTPP